jgi:hypothetical protein
MGSTNYSPVKNTLPNIKTPLVVKYLVIKRLCAYLSEFLIVEIAEIFHPDRRCVLSVSFPLRHLR